MEIKRIALGLLLLCTFLHQAQARLGESEYALTQRYGQPEEVDEPGNNLKQMLFRKDGWKMDATLHYGNCVAILYSKIAHEAGTARDKLLKANTNGPQWSKTKEEDMPLPLPFPGEALTRDDRNAFVVVGSSYRTRFFFYTKQWVRINRPKPTATAPIPNF